MWRRLTAFALTCGLLAAAPGSARADAIPPPPEECPAGTRPVSGHAGASCVPVFCGGSTHDPVPCPAGSRCIPGRAWWPPSEARTPDLSRPGYPTISLAPEGCGCPSGTCVAAEMCVPDDAPLGPCPAVGSDDAGRATQAGCSSCAVGRAGGVPSLLGLVFLLFSAAWSKSRAMARRFVSSSARDRSGAVAVRGVRARHRGGRPGARRG